MSNGNVYVKLRDTGSIFHDASQNFTLTGELVVGECRRTPKVISALKGGVIEELKSEKEYTEACKKYNAGGDVSVAAKEEGSKENEKPDYSKMKNEDLIALIASRKLELGDAKLKADYIQILDDADKKEAEEAAKGAE